MNKEQAEHELAELHEKERSLEKALELINKNRKNIDGVQYYALTMIAGKIVRILNGNPHETDHWSDIIGYATLGGRLELAQEVQEPLVDILPVVNLGNQKQ